MPWRQIAESGVPFTFERVNGTPDLLGSTVVASEQSGPSWAITLTDNVPRNMRVTVNAYDSQRVQGSEAPSYFELTVDDQPASRVTNEFGGNASAFAPNPIVGLATYFVYQAGFGSELFRNEAYEMLVEVDAGLSRIQPILRTFRGYRGSSNTFETWIRDEQGRANLAGAEIRIRVHAYDRGHHRAEVVGEGTAEGRVTFTISHATAQQRLPAGLYRLEIVVGTGEDRQTAQVGLLELI